jgi:HlyD family secretion protein
VVTYEVVISAPNNDLKLKPGLTANVTIYTLEKNDVLVAPSKALRFMPNEALLSEGQKIEDVEAPQKVWTLEGNTLKAHKVETGTSNGMQTEILAGVKEGTEVLVDFKISGGDATEQASQANNPFMPRRPGNNNRNRSGSGANGSGAGNRSGGNSGSGGNGGGAGSSGSGAGGGNAAGSGGPNR